MTRKRQRNPEPREFGTIRELVGTLHLYSKLAPTYHDRDLVVFRCRCEFEPHGKASGTWEILWCIELPFVQYCWRSTTGWRPGKAGLSMKFESRTLYEAMTRLCTFLGEMTTEGKEIEWLQPSDPDAGHCGGRPQS